VDELQPFPVLKDKIHMWCEGYNTYHLIDGAAMHESWGRLMPDILLSKGNLAAVLDKVRWALYEDTMGGTLLSPRMRRTRLRGGAQEMDGGYNTQVLDSEFSVVSVR
jgi:hypothetical protein